MNKKENLTLHNNFVQGIQEDFKQNDGKNPNHTSSPSDAQKKYCAKLNGPDDAVAKADDKFVNNYSEEDLKEIKYGKSLQDYIDEGMDRELVSAIWLVRKLNSFVDKFY